MRNSINTPVYGIALGIPLNKAHTGPFAQFQNCEDKEESLTQLVLQLLNRIPDSDPDRDAVQTQVNTFKKRVDVLLKQMQGKNGGEKKEPLIESASTAKLFEEIKVMFQDLPSRIEDRVSNGAYIRRPTLKRFHPMMLEEITHSVSEDPSDPIGLLILAGFVRDDLPWMYEIIMEAYREAKNGNINEARKSFQTLRQISKSMMRGPWLEDMGMHPKEFDMWMMEFPMIMDHYLHRFEIKNKKHANKSKKVDDK